MGPEFFQTEMGRQFYEGTMPRLVREVARLADAIEKQNGLTEQMIRLQEAERAPDSLRSLADEFSSRTVPNIDFGNAVGDIMRMLRERDPIVVADDATVKWLRDKEFVHELSENGVKVSWQGATFALVGRSVTEKSEPQDIKVQILRWHATFTPRSVPTEAIDALYHKLMNRLPFMAARTGSDDPVETADELVLEWAQDHTGMELDGNAYRQLVNLVAGMVADEAGEGQ